MPPSIYTQVNILRAFQHPNIVSIYQFYRDDPDYFYTVMEYVGGGALYDRIVKQVPRLYFMSLKEEEV